MTRLWKNFTTSTRAHWDWFVFVSTGAVVRVTVVDARQCHLCGAMQLTGRYKKGDGDETVHDDDE